MEETNVNDLLAKKVGIKCALTAEPGSIIYRPAGCTCGDRMEGPPRRVAKTLCGLSCTVYRVNA